jgi:spermidine dehydrogenase
MSSPDSISRRDFLDGVAFAIGAGLVAGGCAPDAPEPPGAQQGPAYYPPALTGLRGDHPGAFETAHHLRDGTLVPGRPRETGENYDLIVVGAGISGLAAAHLFREARGPDSRILILENHDDVGGHAKRNELVVDGRTLITYGGTESIESPAQYSEVAKKLLLDIGIETERFYTAFDRGRDARERLGPAIYFDRATFGEDKVVRGSIRALDSAAIGRLPLSAEGRRDLATLYGSRTQYFPSLSGVEIKARLARTSYRDYLRTIVGLGDDALRLLQVRSHDLFGVGIDAIPALDAWGLEYPGFAGLGLDDSPAPGLGRTPLLEQHEEEPYIFHFPDGNASVARLLVRRLNPAALPGTTMEDVVTSRLDYAQLDDFRHPVRIRLNATVVRVSHAGNPNSAREVRVTYIRDGVARTVRARHCVLACWNMIIPYLCPEMPSSQRDALAYGAKVPIVYASVAVRNWKPWKALGISDVYAPGGYFSHVFLDYPVDLGAWHAARSPDQPTVVRMNRMPCKPGLSAREQQRAGRKELLELPFAVFEREIRNQLQGMLGGAGFDAVRDIAAITVNRWAHGYAYEYNSLWDPIVPDSQRPCVIGRQRFGRVTIANSDAGAFAYTNGAIDQAARAVAEMQAD